MTGTITRRALVKATPAAVESATGSDPELARLIAAYKATRAECDAWHATVYNPAYEALEAAKNAVPHYTTKASYETKTGLTAHMATGHRTSEAVITTFRENGWKFANDDYGRCCAELASAMDERMAKLDAIQGEWDAVGLSKESDRQSDISWAAFMEIHNYPVQTIEDLIAKITFIHSIDSDPCEVEPLLEDLNRIAGRTA